jgi:predicted nucleotidyltransferase component of viral defense system
MDLPIIYKLKRSAQRELAGLQDEVIEVVYELLEDAVMHGGTAIWRCYGGKRFSEDIDLYAVFPEYFKTALDKALKRRGLILTKFRHTGNALFSEVYNGVSAMKLEITRKRVKGTLTPYLKANGNSLDILALKPEELILEKLAAYKNRRKIRDIYDVYFLSRLVNDAKVKKTVKESLEKIETPVDEADLKAIVYEGKVPTFEEMLEKLNVWAKQNT